MKDATQSTSLKLSREEVNRRKIIQAARKLFIEHGGIHDVNMHQIAKTAGVGQASLYRRYSEINDLSIDVVKEECQPLFDQMDQWLKTHAEAQPLERLYSVVEQFADFLEMKSPWLCHVSRSLTGHRPMQSPLYVWMRNCCQRLLEQAQTNNEIEDIDITYTVEALMSALHNLDIHMIDQGFEKHRILQGIRRLYIDGLKVK